MTRAGASKAGWWWRERVRNRMHLQPKGFGDQELLTWKPFAMYETHKRVLASSGVTSISFRRAGPCPLCAALYAVGKLRLTIYAQ